MRKNLVPVLLILLIVLSFGRLVSTQASLNSTSKMKVSVTAATLDFKLNGDKNDSLKIDLGEVKPGDSGTVEIKVNNIGDISGSLCINGQNSPSELKVQSIDTCGVNVVPNDSIQFEINWSLPIGVHNTGVNGADFQFSYTFTFVNGFRVTKDVILKGIINDPADDPTPTPTDTATTVVTETATETSVPIVTDTPVPTEVILTDTEVPPAATEIVTDTQVPIEVIPTDVPIEVPTDVPTEVQ